MELNDYQKQAMKTCMESSNNFSYMMLNLVGEVGEFASKLAKVIRQEKACIYYDNIDYNEEEWYTDTEEETYTYKKLEKIAKERQDEFKSELQKEAGDIMWQLFGLISVMGWDAEEIARQNLEKLKSRKQRNVIDGNGDNR